MHNEERQVVVFLCTHIGNLPVIYKRVPRGVFCWSIRDLSDFRSNEGHSVNVDCRRMGMKAGDRTANHWCCIHMARQALCNITTDTWQRSLERMLLLTAAGATWTEMKGPEQKCRTVWNKCFLGAAEEDPKKFKRRWFWFPIVSDFLSFCLLTVVKLLVCCNCLDCKCTFPLLLTKLYSESGRWFLYIFQIRKKTAFI